VYDCTRFLLEVSNTGMATGLSSPLLKLFLTSFAVDTLLRMGGLVGVEAPLPSKPFFADFPSPSPLFDRTSVRNLT
jgi:hypothetical protein